MTNFIITLTERVLKIPSAPESPPGDETTTRSFRAAPNFYNYLLFTWGIKTLATGVGLVMWFAFLMPKLIREADKEGWGRWVFLLVIFEIGGVITTIAYWIYSWFAVRLDFDKRWYVVTDRSLRVREGIVTVREATVTFANIQNISISQGPLQRVLGIADLRVDTAGGGSISAHENKHVHNLHTTFFRGVNNAPEIRDLMKERLRKLKDAGLGDHDDVQTMPESPTTTSTLEVLRQIHAEAVLLRESVARGS
jgi:membrane protein YdbS with pleckstrin-like domain